MDILKLKPAVKDYLWGGRKLVEYYNKESELEKVAETWEMSNHKDGSSIIVNGSDKGKTFAKYLEEQGKNVWGTKAQKYDEFPIMIKFIDAKQALSIQVHPDDEYALKNEGEFGKNEFWYVLEAEPNAFLYYGVKEEMTQDEYRQHIEDDVICDYLNKVEVKKGDCFFIEAGTIHAIGAGIVIAEIQQCSNSTYRVYDFGRVGVDGKPRELHIDKAVDVSKLTPSKQNGEADGKVIQEEGYTTQLLTESDYFVCHKIDVETVFKGAITEETFQTLTVLEGDGSVRYNDEIINVIKGDTLFIPATKGNYEIEGQMSFIMTHL